MGTATANSLFDVEPLSCKQTAEIAAVLMDKLDRVGMDALSVDEQVELRLLRTLLDGFAD